MFTIVGSPENVSGWGWRTKYYVQEGINTKARYCCSLSGSRVWVPQPCHKSFFIFLLGFRGPHHNYSLAAHDYPTDPWLQLAFKPLCIILNMHWASTYLTTILMLYLYIPSPKLLEQLQSDDEQLEPQLSQAKAGKMDLQQVNWKKYFIYVYCNESEAEARVMLYFRYISMRHNIGTCTMKMLWRSKNWRKASGNSLSTRSNWRKCSGYVAVACIYGVAFVASI